MDTYTQEEQELIKKGKKIYKAFHKKGRLWKMINMTGLQQVLGFSKNTLGSRFCNSAKGIMPKRLGDGYYLRLGNLQRIIDEEINKEE